MQDIYTYTMILSIISFAVATVFTPGPNNLMLLSSGLTFGYKRTLSHILGIVVGFPVMVVSVGLGVGTLLKEYPMIYAVLKIVGILYLLWMAWHIANTTGSMTTSEQSTDKPFTFMQGALFQWVNPKAWIMAVTATSSFTTEESYIFIQVLIIAFIYFIAGMASTNTWALGGVFLQKLISNEKRVRVFNISMALLIVLSVLPFVFQ